MDRDGLDLLAAAVGQVDRDGEPSEIDGERFDLLGVATGVVGGVDVVVGEYHWHGSPGVVGDGAHVRLEAVFHLAAFSTVSEANAHGRASSSTNTEVPPHCGWSEVSRLVGDLDRAEGVGRGLGVDGASTTQVNIKAGRFPRTANFFPAGLHGFGVGALDGVVDREVDPHAEALGVFLDADVVLLPGQRGWRQGRRRL